MKDVFQAFFSFLLLVLPGCAPDVKLNPNQTLLEIEYVSDRRYAGGDSCEKVAGNKLPQILIDTERAQLIEKLGRCGLKHESSLSLIGEPCRTISPNVPCCLPLITNPRSDSDTFQETMRCAQLMQASFKIHQTQDGSAVEVYRLKLCDGPDFLNEEQALARLKSIFESCLE